MPKTLTELCIDTEHFDEIAAKAVRIGRLADAYVPLTEDDVKAILTTAL